MLVGLLPALLFETDAELGFFVFAKRSFFFVASPLLFREASVFLGEALRLFLFLLLPSLFSNALALSRLSSKLLLFLLTNTDFFDAHEFAKVEENGRLFFLGHDETYITLFRCIRTRGSVVFSRWKR